MCFHQTLPPKKTWGLWSADAEQVNGWKAKPVDTEVHVLLPHEVIHALAGRNAFDSLLLGNLSDDARVAFWDHVEDLPPWKHHPVLKSGVSKKRLIGCNIHADGVQFYREDEYFVWSWSSVWGGQGMVKDVLLYKWPIAVIPERHMRTPQVRAAVNTKIAQLTSWSMDIAARGTGPLRGFMGESLAGTPREHLMGAELALGWRACYFAFKGDLKARKEVHELPRYYRCNQFCDRCLATQGTKCPRSMDYRNIASDAAWPMTAISHETYMALDHASLSPWRCMPGFNFLSITYDFTHNFFLGTARDLCASSIKVFIDNGLVGDPRTKGMGELLCLVHRRMRSMCREHGLSLPCKPNLTLANIGGEDGYFTMGSRWKASHIKLFVWWVAKESDFLGPTSHQDPLLHVLAACAFGLQRSCEVMDLAGVVLTEMEAGEVHECLSVHLRAYFWLAAFFYQ
ncbi:unnamed protein product, partial [Durusdinium trenchii]